MKTLNRKLRRDLWRVKGMLLAVTAIIAVGTGSMIGMMGTVFDLDAAKTSYYSRGRMADFWVSLKKAPESEAAGLIDIDGVSAVRTRIEFPVIVDMPEVEEPVSGLAISLPDERETVINNVIMRGGGYFTESKRKEVIVSEKFAAARGIAPGTFIDLVLNGQKKKMFVVGIGISPEFVYLTQPGNFAPAPGKYGIFWIKRSFAEDVFGFHGACNSVVGLLDPEIRRTPNAALDGMKKRLSSYGVFTCQALKEQSSNLTLATEMSGVTQQAVIFPLVFLSVAAMVLNVIMIRMTEQERVVIGTLKALGVSTIEVFSHYLKFGGAVGLLGGAAGCALGWMIEKSMTGMYGGLFTFPSLDCHFYPELMLIGMAISLGCAMLGALRGARRIVELNPAEAMHPPPPPSMGKIILERWSWLWRKLDFRWQIVMRSLFRNKGRSVVGLVAAAMGAAMLVMALGMNNSIIYMVEFQFDKVLRGDYFVSFRDELDGDALLDVKRMDGVSLAEPQIDVACHFTNGNHVKKGVVTGLVKGSELTVPCGKNGQPVRVPETGLLMTRRLAEELDLKVGDMVTMTPVKGLRQPKRMPINGLVDSSFGLAVYADYDYLNRLIDEMDAISAIRLRARFTPAEKRGFAAQAKKWPKLSSFESVAAQKKQINKKMVKTMRGISLVMVFFAGVIFFGSILNAALISLAEKKREIASFRVLGYYPGEVGAIFWRETATINLTGAILGLPLGYAMLYATSLQFRNEIYAMYCVVYPSTWIWSIGLAATFTFSAHMIVQHLIKNMNWSEALQMKE